MKRLCALALLVFALFCVIARGDEGPLATYNTALQAARKAIDAKDFKEAEKQAKIALSLYPGAADANDVLRSIPAGVPIQVNVPPQQPPTVNAPDSLYSALSSLFLAILAAVKLYEKWRGTSGLSAADVLALIEKAKQKPPT